MNLSLPHGPRRFAHRTRRRIRREPDFLCRLNHPEAPGFWNGDRAVSGWIASDRPVAAVTLCAPGRPDDPARLVARPDVDWKLRGRFRCRTGFSGATPVFGWLGDAARIELRVRIDWAGGGSAEAVFGMESRSDERKAKRARFEHRLRCPVCGGTLRSGPGERACSACGARFPERIGIPDFLTREAVQAHGADETENVSDWEYDPRIVEELRKQPDGLFLDCGAGLRRTAYPQVVHLDIVRYSTTDVVGVAERLPFADGTFDGVISVAVLEHVRDPFQCARELVRVLKPGGVCFAAVPFLQPRHAYPHHYFNMTGEGLRSLFPDLADVEQFVPLSLHPLQSIQWILLQYWLGLSPAARRRFARMTVDDLINCPKPDDPAAAGLAVIHDLDQARREDLAGGTCLIGRKRS